MVQGGMSCIKYLLFIFNFIFVICGLVLIIVGALVIKKDETKTEFLDNKYATAPSIIIAVGCIIFVVAFLGCCGAVKESYCMVMTFGLLVFVIFVIELAGGISAYMYKGEAKDILRQTMNESLVQLKEDAVKVWDDMQIKWQCCGLDGAHDYVGLSRQIPSSCCKEQKNPCSQEDAWKAGCFSKMLDIVTAGIALIGGVAIGFAVIELLGCMFAWCLASAIKREA